MLAALGAAPLIEVEAEGLPLSLVRAAETPTRAAATPPTPPPDDDELAGALFLATAAIRADAGPSLSRPETQAATLLEALLREGLEEDEVRRRRPGLPVTAETAAR